MLCVQSYLFLLLILASIDSLSPQTSLEILINKVLQPEDPSHSILYFSKHSVYTLETDVKVKADQVSTTL